MDAEYRKVWSRSRDDLLQAVTALGFPEELGSEIAKNLGSPKAMNRMTVYLNNVKPKTVELVVDEMLAIMEEIEIWREKKSGQQANTAYNEMRYYGLGGEEE